MRKHSLIIFVAIFFATSFVPHSVAQDRKESLQRVTAAGTKNDQPKGEVDLALEDLNKQGEGVFRDCLKKCKDSKNIITSGVTNGRAVDIPQPAYPVVAAAAHAYGDVVVLLIIDKQGHVIAAQIETGHPLLRAVTLRAAKEARFTPTLLEGKPVYVLGKITYHFVSR
jgi:TonB family protein